ncbi:MAG: DUF6326 family protein [Cyanobacteria bacterium P01_D01_bin.123]
MHAHPKLVAIDTRALLSTLWTFVLFNVVFRDLHDFFSPGFIEELIAGVGNGNQVTNETLLVAAMVMEIPIAMILLSRILRYRVNRWANIIAGTLTIAFTIALGIKDLDDTFFAIVDIAALSAILRLAWKWRHDEPSPPILSRT